jgi:hypothetical protein
VTAIVRAWEHCYQHTARLTVSPTTSGVDTERVSRLEHTLSTVLERWEQQEARRGQEEVDRWTR